MTPPLWQKVKKNKEPLDENERGEWKVWLKTQPSVNKDHGYSPITSWQIDGETAETVADFILGGSKITADDATAMKLKEVYSLEEKLWPI